MGPLALMAIGAAMGAAKSQLVDKPKEDRDRKKAEAFAKCRRGARWTSPVCAKPTHGDPRWAAPAQV